MPVFAQINHNGGQGSSMYSRLPVWAPSPVPDPLFREVPKAVDETEIAEIIDGYATVAARCIEGGFDGVELQCSHSSIVRGFLSPVTNLRSDRYGGTLRNRARLLLELVAAVRAAVGPDRALGVRLCGDELIEGGTGIDDAVEVAGLVDATGMVDYVNTSIGVATASLFMIEASMQVPPGYASYVSSAIREAVSVPVVGVGRFKDPLQADRALRTGICDLVGVVRGQIADAEFASKARSGHPTDIRTCLSCNQECVGRMGLNRWLGCIENPRTGREAATLPEPRRRRKVVVVGGGPGGLQAAVTAAERGHSVTLFERRDRLGGQVQVAATVPGRAEFFDLARNLIVAARREGVELRTGREASAAEVLAEQPDAVIVATGARPARPWWADEHPRVVDVRDVLEGRVDPGGEVVIVDELGFHQATSTGELLAERGCRVRDRDQRDGGRPRPRSHPRHGDLAREGARQGHRPERRSRADGCRRHGGRPGAVLLRLQHHRTGTDEQRVCDWVVCSVHQEPEDELWRALRTESVRIERVGDCLAPRRAARGGRRGAPGGGNAVSAYDAASPPAALAVVVARDGRLPAGAGEATAEAGDALVVGSGTETAATALAGARRVWWLETGHGLRPAALAERLAPLLGAVTLILMPASPDGRDLAPRSRRGSIGHSSPARSAPRWSTCRVADDAGVRATASRLDDRVLVPVEVEGPAVATLVPGSRAVPSERARRSSNRSARWRPAAAVSGAETASRPTPRSSPSSNPTSTPWTSPTRHGWSPAVPASQPASTITRPPRSSRCWARSRPRSAARSARRGWRPTPGGPSTHGRSARPG